MGKGKKKGGSVYFNGASIWLGKGNDPDKRRVMCKLPDVPLFAVQRGIAAEEHMRELLAD